MCTITLSVLLDLRSLFERVVCKNKSSLKSRCHGHIAWWVQVPQPNAMTLNYLMGSNPTGHEHIIMFLEKRSLLRVKIS